MLSFQNHIDEASALKFYNLLPKKVRHTINRIKNRDKYKAALLMIKHLRKDPDVISRGLNKARIQGIAADYFGLNHRELSKVLNRQTRYEVRDYNIGKEIGNLLIESYTINYSRKSDISMIKYSDEQYSEIENLYKKLGADSLIFDPKKKKFKVNSALDSKYKLGDLEKTYTKLVGPKGGSLMVWGTGSVSKTSSIELATFGIATATDFLEFFQAIGLFIPKKLEASTFKEQLGKLKIIGDFQIRNYIKEWEKFIAYIDADKSMGKDVMMLVNGSHFYRVKEANFDKPYVIWTGITTYYSNLKSKEGLETDIKPNTADVVLIDGTPAALYKALKTDDPVVTNDDTGMLSCGGINWFQISLKKAEGGAKLGKITKLLKGKYTVDGEVQSNMDRAGVSDLFTEEAYAQLLAEGFFGDAAAKMKKIGGDALKKFKAAAVNILKFGKRLMANIAKLGKKYETSTMKDIERLTKRSKYLKENLNEMSSTAMLRAIVEDPSLNKKYIGTINREFNNVAKAKNTDVVSVNMPRHKMTVANLKVPGALNFLVSNVISFKLITDIINDVNKNGIDVINDLNRSMAMGDTKLPVVKVYGNPDKADYDIITVGKISQAAPERDGGPIKVLKVAILPLDNYWVINMWIFASLDKGIAKYHKIAFKKSGSSAFNYNIEGTSTVPEDKITEFPI